MSALKDGAEHIKLAPSSTHPAPGQAPTPLVATESQPSEKRSFGAHQLPDSRPRDTEVRARYAGKHVVVAGTGASAKGALIGLTELAKEECGNTNLLACPASHRG